MPKNADIAVVRSYRALPVSCRSFKNGSQADLMLEQLSAGLSHFPATAISATLADKTGKARISVWHFGDG